MDRNFNYDQTPEQFIFTVNLPWYREPAFLAMSSVGLMTTLLLLFLLVFRYVKLEHLVNLRTQKLNQANLQLSQDAVQLREAEIKLRGMSSELTIAEERERRKIASFLHDTIGHTLALCKLKISRFKKNCSDDQVDQIEEISSFTEQSIEDIHSIIFQISPPVLYELGFDRAVKWLVDEYQEQYQISIQYNASNVIEPVPEDRKILLFQIIRELLVNIVKHAQASEVHLQVERKNGSVHIKVQDNGKGFRVEQIEEEFKGYGLFSIRQRLQYIEGSLEIHSQINLGSTISVVAPIESGISNE
ncbi:MAG: sensor histidine kinase [Candidatus Hinthialibacter antarcticus]|nr:sensor histidine kinase [Candidatus Hinthialibacter antarcticus]